jgi:hypothetical protein
VLRHGETQHHQASSPGLDGERVVHRFPVGSHLFANGSQSPPQLLYLRSKIGATGSVRGVDQSGQGFA